VTIVVGVDGGNTKTLAVVAAPGGRVLGTGHGACGDIYGAISPAHALNAIAGAVEDALAAAGASRDEIEAAAFSLAGADWPEDFSFLERELRERMALPVTPVVVNDSLGALRAGAPDWEGVAVVSGTYNAVGARRADGRTFHLGFWPDGAGGRDLGRAAYRAVLRADLGLGPPTALTGRALSLYGVEDAIALVHEFTRRGGLDEAAHDRMAPVVLDTADEGDEVAQSLVAATGRLLGEQARVCAERAGLALEGTRIVLSGRVLQHPTRRLANAVMEQLPGAEAVRTGAPPVVGAVLLAFDRLGLGPGEDAGALAAGLATERSLPWAGSPSSA
jgi:N-acetylglucosamine kinase-like BadF-type ATPase